MANLLNLEVDVLRQREPGPGRRRWSKRCPPRNLRDGHLAVVFIMLTLGQNREQLGPAMAIGVRRPGLTDVRSLVVNVVAFAVAAVTYASVFLALLSILDLWAGGDPSPGIVALVGVLLAALMLPYASIWAGGVELATSGTPSPRPGNCPSRWGPTRWARSSSDSAQAT